MHPQDQHASTAMNMLQQVQAAAANPGAGTGQQTQDIFVNGSFDFGDLASFSVPIPGSANSADFDPSVSAEVAINGTPAHAPARNGSIADRRFSSLVIVELQLFANLSNGNMDDSNVDFGAFLNWGTP
jgi:hypothetical protein